MEIELFSLLFDGMTGGLGNSLIIMILLAIAGITFTLTAVKLDPLFAIVVTGFPFIMFALYAGFDIQIARFVIIGLLALIGSISIGRLLVRS